SCKIEYYIKTNSAYFSSQSAFFTDDDFMMRLQCNAAASTAQRHRRFREDERFTIDRAAGKAAPSD
uniref:hypothetical protein n=1 Tax=Bradyrhizobium sp. 33ap4 TaxID=3061630 RepID=UPI00292F3F4A